MSNNPPKPRLALSVGVIGHRPERLDLAKADLAKINSEVDHVLDMIVHEVGVVHRRYAAFFSEAKPQLCLVDALAEGADRIVADAARAKGFVLDVPIPFARDEYVRDFGTKSQETDADTRVSEEKDKRSSVDKFDALVANEAVRSFLELPGKRNGSGTAEHNAEKAYEMAGLTVIGQSDILLTIWDRGPSGGRGGTADMLHEAVRRGVPIIEIDVSEASETRICWSSLRESPISAEQIEDLPTEGFDQILPRLIEEFLRPPSADTEREALLSYFGSPTHRNRSRLRVVVAWIAAIGGSGGERRAERAALHAGKYSTLMKSISGYCSGTQRTTLATAFGWADVMAMRFARTFRFAFVFNFLVAAAAVIAALCSLLIHNTTPVVLEVVLIMLVLVNTIIGRKLGWHLRWMEAREVAERMRVAVLFWILGTQPPAFFGEEPAWTGWYARAVVREQGMRPGQLDREGMSKARAAMLDVLEHQHAYHRENASKMKRREHRLEWIGFIFFGGTLLVALAHIWGASLLDFLFQQYPNRETILIMLSAILPALAAASYGIRIIGDYEGIAKRSERTEQGHQRVIEALLRDPADLMLFRARAQVVADAMLGDVSSWRLSTESRGLAIPG